MTANEFRRLALSLPEVVEAAHMGHPTFGWPEKSSPRLAILVGMGCRSPDGEQQDLFVRTEPKSFMPVKGGWGRAGATNVRLPSARKRAVPRGFNHGMAQSRAPAWEGAVLAKQREGERLGPPRE